MLLTLAGRPALSTPGVRLACIVSPLRDARHAETEARIVMASSEPVTSNTLHTPLGAALCTPLWHAAPMASALAEALAAFVED